MCGRFGFDIPAPRVAEHYELAEVPEVRPRYNIAPTQPVAAIMLDGVMRVLRKPSWGFALPGGGAKRVINARAETVGEKPMFRQSLRTGRCLIPASGFYEWRKMPDGSREPHHFSLSDGGIMSFAGLYAPLQEEDGTERLACVIITVEANELMRPIHDRMPALLSRDMHSEWLASGGDAYEEMLRPFDAGGMREHVVSTRVNSVANDDPSLAAPASSQGVLPF